MRPQPSGEHAARVHRQNLFRDTIFDHGRCSIHSGRDVELRGVNKQVAFLCVCYLQRKIKQGVLEQQSFDVLIFPGAAPVDS